MVGLTDRKVIWANVGYSTRLYKPVCTYLSLQYPFLPILETNHTLVACVGGLLPSGHVKKRVASLHIFRLFLSFAISKISFI